MKEEVERLVAWMEENRQDLKGKQIAWHKDVKDQVFADDEHIMVKKITEKANNMKRRWKEAKTMLELSGWGVRLEDNEQSINDVLDRKCAFFWRLDEIWGTCPNASVIDGNMDSSNPLPNHIAGITDTQDDTQLKWTPTPPLHPSPPPQSIPTPAPASVPEPASTPPSRSRSSTPMQLRTGKRDSSSILRQTLEERYDIQEELASKRHKIEMDIKREKIAGEERIAGAKVAAEERIADRQLEQGERIAQMQADAQTKQTESFTRVMEKMLDVFGPAGSAHRAL